jgi:hypothetical protein
MSVDMSEPWPLDIPGEVETVVRRRLGGDCAEPPGALAGAMDCIARLRIAKADAGAEIAQQRQELHDLRNDLHAIRMQLAARDAEMAHLRAKVATATQGRRSPDGSG